MESRERAALRFVAAAMAVAAFALGSAPRWAVCITAALCLASMVPLISSRRAFDERPRILVFLAIAIGMTAGQAIPLPAAIVEWLSPYRWQLVVDNAVAWGEAPPSWTALSYDPPASLVELAKLSGYAVFAFTCTWLASYSTGRRRLLAIAVIVAGAIAMTAVAHFVVGTKLLFGLYKPKDFAPRFVAPLLNPNHLAALLAFATPLSIGLAVASPGRRILWLGLGSLTAGVCLLTESRGGAIALVMGLMTAAGFMWIQKRRGDAAAETPTKIPRAVVVPAVIVMACALALLAAFTAGGVIQELSSTSTDELSDAGYKLEAWRSSQKLMAHHPLTGVGRGGFEAAFTRPHPSGQKVFSHVENEYLQTIIDWGIPAAAGMALVLILMVVTGFRRGLVGPLEAGAVGGLVALAAHNFVDFNLQFPAIALPAIAAVAVILPGRLQKSRSYRRRIPLRIAAIAGGVLVLFAASSPWGTAARDETDDLADKILIGSSDAVASARELTDRHPSDYLSFGLAAQALADRSDAKAPRIINRAQVLNPEHPGLHHLAAQMLIASANAQEAKAATAKPDEAATLRKRAAMARTQSLVEYALALKTSLDPRAILADLIANIPDVETASHGLPLDPELAEEIDKQLHALGRADIALAHLRLIHKEIPDNGEVAGLLSEYALLRGDVPLAVETGKQAYAYNSLGKNSLRYGRALSAAGRNGEALAILTDAINHARARGTREDTVMLMVALGDVQRLLGKLTEAQETFVNAGDIIGGDRKGAAEIKRGLARVYDALGNPNQAAVERRRAERLDPTDMLDAGLGATGDAGTGTAGARDAGTGDAGPPRQPTPDAPLRDSSNR